MQCPAWHLNFLHFFVFHLTHTTHLNTFQTKYTPSCPINCGSPMDQTSGLQDIPCLISLGSGDFQVKLMPWALHHVPSDIPLKFHCMKGTLFCWGVQLRGWEGVLSLKQCLRGMCQVMINVIHFACWGFKCRGRSMSMLRMKRYITWDKTFFLQIVVPSLQITCPIKQVQVQVKDIGLGYAASWPGCPHHWCQPLDIWGLWSRSALPLQCWTLGPGTPCALHSTDWSSSWGWSCPLSNAGRSQTAYPHTPPGWSR